MDEPQRSIIIAVYRGYRSPHPVSIIRLETPPPQEVVESLPLPLSLPRPLNGNKFLAHVPDLLKEVEKSYPGLVVPYDDDDDDDDYDYCRVAWGFPLPTTCFPEKLYIFSNMFYARVDILRACGISFDLSSKICKTIPLPSIIPTPMLYTSLAIDLPSTVGDCIFFPFKPHSSLSCFVRYNTLSDSWDNHQLYPPQNHIHQLQQVSGTAVLHDDIILFNVALAWVVSKNKWYPVTDPNHLCSNILGQAVVVNNIIYALDRGYTLVMFAFNPGPGPGPGGSYTCDLLKTHVYDVPSMDFLTPYGEGGPDLHKELVHLGKDNFCVVHNWDMGAVCDHEDYDYENCPRPCDRHYIQLTYITLCQEEKELIVTGIRLHGFEIPCGDYIVLSHCFSLPNSKFNASFEEGGTTREQEADLFVTLPPDLLQFSVKNPSFIFDAEDKDSDVSKKPSASVVSPKRNVPTIARTITAVTVTEASTHGDVVVSGKRDAYENKGHYICVINLPYHFKFAELNKELKKFGAFELVSTHPDHSQMSNSIVVEFGSATSKQNAIKGSPINIGGCRSVIKSGSSLTQRDSNCSSSSGSKVKKHSEGKLNSVRLKAGTKSRKRNSKGDLKITA